MDRRDQHYYRPRKSHISTERRSHTDDNLTCGCMIFTQAFVMMAATHQANGYSFL